MLRHLLLQALLLGGIALSSGYRIPSLDDSNWDIVLFLTPAGIVRNYFGESPVLRSFYSESSTGQLALSDTQWAVLLSVYVGLAVNAAMAFRKIRSSTEPKPKSGTTE